MTISLKSLSIGFLYGASSLLVIDALHIVLVYKIEVGLLDFLPANGIMTVFILYPFLLLASAILTFNRKEKLRRDEKILFGLNVLAVIIILYFLFI